MDVVKVYNELLKKYGRQGWWPVFMKCKIQNAECKIGYNLKYGIPYPGLKNCVTPYRDPYFEIAVGAILTQNTAWKNVVIAIQNLADAKALTPKRLLKLSTPRLQKLIRSAGYFRQKAKKLRLFAQWLIDDFEGDMQKLKRFKIHNSRFMLLEQWGVGNETADSILLYALNKPIFVVDEYTRRLCRYYGIEFSHYDEYRLFFESQLEKAFPSPRERTKVYQEYHGLIVAWGKSPDHLNT